MFRLSLAAALLLVSTAAAEAEAVRLSAQEIKDTVIGSVLEVDTPFGTKLPIRYSEDGGLTGEAGGLSFFLGASTDRGRWWIAENRLCHKWTIWFGAEPQCLRLAQDGQRIHWRRDDGKSGTAVVVSRSASIVRRDPRASSLGAPPVAEPRAASVVGAPRIAALSPPVAAIPPRPTVANAERQDAGALKPKSQASAAQPPRVNTDRPPASVKHKPALGMAVATQGKAPPPETQTKKKASTAPVPVVAKAQQTKAHESGVETSSAAIEASFRVAGVEDDDILNVRGGPSQQHPAIGVLLPRERGVRIIGACQEDWCPVRHGRTMGWVNRYYLVEEQPAWASEQAGVAAPRARR